MATTKFTDEELKNGLFMEMINHDDGQIPGFVEFHGFYTDDVLMRARDTRTMVHLMPNTREPRMSEYLRVSGPALRRDRGSEQADAGYEPPRHDMPTYRPTVYPWLFRYVVSRILPCEG